VNPGIEIAEAVAEDAPGFAHSQLHAWRRAYAGVMDPSYLASMGLERMTRRWSEMLGEPVPGVHHLALRAGGETVGWSRCGNPRDDVEDGTGELHAINLLPDFWSQGLGSRLFRASVEGLRQMGHVRAYLWVAKGNDRGSLSTRRFFNQRELRTPGLQARSPKTVPQSVGSADGVAANQGRQS
jgi:GNAT superfamily N-acetyltransferase